MHASVVIPTYNHSHFLREALDSALGQTLAPHEVIVVDDGSTDETPEILASYGERIRVVRQENRGLASARNAGAERVRGDSIAFLDSDDVWMPTKLERQLARLRDEPELGLVHCAVENIDASGRAVGRRLDGLEGWVAEEMLLFRRGVILGGGSGFVVRRRAFEAEGGFDTRMGTSADWDLQYRIAARHRVGFVPEVLLRYRFHASNMHANIRAMEHDMLLAYAKAFAAGGHGLKRIRRRSYGNLHTVLAGSFFDAAQYGKFAEHMLKSLLRTPGNGAQFALYPLRRLGAVPRRHGLARSAPRISS
jgi:glycosyltransferase involved in cell wall biosynthesis